MDQLEGGKFVSSFWRYDSKIHCLDSTPIIVNFSHMLYHPIHCCHKCINCRNLMVACPYDTRPRGIVYPLVVLLPIYRSLGLGM